MRDVYGKPRSFTERVRQTGAAEWNPILFLLSGGTTGMPILAAYTTYEIDNIIPHIAGMMYVFGWEPGMRALNMFPALPRLAFFQLLFSGLKVDQGAGIFHTCGEEAVPTEMQVAIAVQMPFDAYFAVPSLMADWLEKAVGMIDGGMPKPAPVKFAAVGAEPLSDEHREKLKSQFEKIGSPDVKIVEGYGCAELKAAFFECDQNSGLHLNPEFYFWEVLDPETEEPVEWGRPGVLCFSHVGWRGSVFLRYRTGDIAGGGVAWKRCGKCGLTLPLMMSPISRATSGPST
jgi:phenylacetate-CoA ligase